MKSLPPSVILIGSGAVLLVFTSALSNVFGISGARPDFVLPLVFYVSLRRAWPSALAHVAVFSYLQDIFSASPAGFHLPAYLGCFALLRLVNVLIDLRHASSKAMAAAFVLAVSRVIQALAAATMLDVDAWTVLSADAPRLPLLALTAAVTVPPVFKLLSRLDKALGHGGPGRDHDIPREARRLTTGRILLPDESDRRR